MATGIATLSVITSLMAAYALVYFRIKYASFFFWLIFITLLVPLELRIMPTYLVMSKLNLLKSSKKIAALGLENNANFVKTDFRKSSSVDNLKKILMKRLKRQICRKTTLLCKIILGSLASLSRLLQNFQMANYDYLEQERRILSF